MAYTCKNINITKITMYPGNNMEAISIFIKRSTKEFNIIALYNSPYTKAQHLYAFMDFIVKEREIYLSLLWETSTSIHLKITIHLYVII